MEIIGILAFIAAFFIFVGIKLYRPRTVIREYKIEVCCVPRGDLDALHELDEDLPVQTVIHIITASGHEQAKELALDEFHNTIPIKVLDDFFIDAMIMESWPLVNGSRQIEKKIAHDQIRDHVDECS